VLGSYHSFFLPSYAEAQALALEALASTPSRIVSQSYDIRIKSYINDETLKDV
jgi:hypothetical protein